MKKKQQQQISDVTTIELDFSYLFVFIFRICNGAISNSW